MARKARDYAAEYARRAERAGGGGALYRQRIERAAERFGPRAPGPVRRGHGREALEGEVRSGRAALVFPIAGVRDEATGRYRSITFAVQDAEGNVRQYRLSGRAITAGRLDQLAAAMAAGATAFIPSPSFDVFVPEDDEDEAEDDEYEEEGDEE